MIRRRYLEVAFSLGVGACAAEAPPADDGVAETGGGILFTTGETSSAGDDDGDALRLDVAEGEPGGGPGDCSQSGGSDSEAFSLIWIANSPEGTVSKIDTRTGQELARYYTGPTNGDDDPSRTSVNLQGDVAVTNRGGGIAKFAAGLDRCVDANGNGTIETSQGPGDIRPFGQDECLLWHADLPGDGDHRHGPRPTAWDSGAAGDPCQTADDRVWVGWWDYPSNEGRFRRLAGADGSTLTEVAVGPWHPEQEGNHYGPYGGAVDAAGILWVVGRNPGPLVRIDGDAGTFERWEVPERTAPYGIALDANGHPWLAGTQADVVHFDPTTEQFDPPIFVEGVDRLRGLQIDRAGHLWVAANRPCGAIRIDTATNAILGGLIPLEGCSDPVGVSIDDEGFVWLPDRGANRAYKLDPATLTATTTEGLVAPYTYSDMTGAGLGLVVNPPQG